MSLAWKTLWKTNVASPSLLEFLYSTYLSISNFVRDWRKLPNSSVVFSPYNVFADSERFSSSSELWNVSRSKRVLASEMLIKKDGISFETAGDSIG